MRVFSGIRPSGKLHIGNYLGAIRQWVKMQKEHQCIFSIVDWHAITTPFDPQTLQDRIFNYAIAYLASGVDPQQSIFFVQSQVKEHAELAWLLGTVTPVGELQRMTQYKQKLKQLQQSPKAGLLNYPILMAADILLYQTQLVPVGQDQVQHVELTRDIARKFNRRFGKLFEIPESFVPKIGAKIADLQHPRNKMSKTGPSKGRIGLFDSPQQIQQKIKSSVTDSGRKIKYDPESKPGISNLLTIYAGFSDLSLDQLEQKFEGQGYAEFKSSLADLLIKKLKPFRAKKQQFSEQQHQLQQILNQGADRARNIARTTMTKVRSKMGLQ